MRKTKFLKALLISLVVCGLIAAGLVTYMIYTKPKEYVQSVSMAEEASAKALIWLSEIEDVNLTYEDMRNIMGDISIQVQMTPTEEKGVYTQDLIDDSYDTCLLAANEGLYKAFCEVVVQKLVSEGYEGVADYDTVESLMYDTYGISVSEYLDSCGVELIPSFETLNEKYSKEVANE